MINCSKFVCSKNLLDTILLLLDSVRAIIIFRVNWSTAVLNLLRSRINWIRAISIICVNCLNCQPLYIRTVDTVKTHINFAGIAITQQIQSNSVITNRLGLTKFVRYNREFVVSEFVNAVDMEFGTEKMGKICSL
jgi:hypothetical protein